MNAERARHFVLDRPIGPPYPENSQRVLFAMGCFWGAEKIFWSLPGVYTTSVGYSGGEAPDPDYRLVCTGTTGHAEVVEVVYFPARISFATLLRSFWEGHDPTQGMRQGNDVGSQYRSAIYCEDQEQLREATDSRERYQSQLTKSGYGSITTEIGIAGTYYLAEDYHQQYLAKNPGGYCGLGGTGIRCG